MQCVNCQAETSNPKFCTRSCSVQYNNVLCPKRTAKVKFCKECASPLPKAQRRLCDTCFKSTKRTTVDGTRQPYETLRLMDILTNDTQRYARVREMARSVARVHGKVNQCQICGYSRHVETCHLLPIHTFSEDTLITEVNNPANLIGLCRNHHWELDHGFLTL